MLVLKFLVRWFTSVRKLVFLHKKKIIKNLKKIKMEEIYNRFCCFLGGNILTIFFVPVETILQTIVLGFVGGMVGMLSRDLYNYIKKLFWEK